MPLPDGPLAVALTAGVVYVAMVARGVTGWPRALKVVPALALAAGADGGLLTAAFLLSAAGDAFLLDKSRFLLAGLGAFLAAHVAFALAFAARGTPAWPLAGIVGLAAALVLARLWPRLKGKLRVAVPVYAASLAGMAAAAAGVGPLGLLGGLLFVVSDSLLAVRTFGRTFPGADVGVMVTYYGALALLAVAATS